MMINICIVFMSSVDCISGVSSLDKFLVKAYSQQTKETNGATGKLNVWAASQCFVHCKILHYNLTSSKHQYGSKQLKFPFFFLFSRCSLFFFSVHTQNLMLRGSKENTSLHPKLTATMLRDHYVKELHLIKTRGSHYA